MFGGLPFVPIDNTPYPHYILEGVYMTYNRIKEKIIESGYTNKYLAKFLDVHQTEISQWISGRREIPKDKKGKLARKLNCKMSDLYNKEQV
tara:strand:- start:1011 stop:1283 length:273 start_codon:yes stop_codon:yes gene_type:complete